MDVLPTVAVPSLLAGPEKAVAVTVPGNVVFPLSFNSDIFLVTVLVPASTLALVK